MRDHTPTVLLIDNDDAVVKALTTRLERFGCRCISAGTGAQGLAAFQDQSVDLVITDLNMPLGDGIALATAIRQTSDVPIIVITGYRENYARELRNIRNVTTIRKPFDSRQLLELVEGELALHENVTVGDKGPSRTDLPVTGDA